MTKKQDAAAVLSRLFFLHCGCMQKAANDCGLYRGQPPILEYLKLHNGCSQKQLATALQVSPASVAVSIRRMEKSGLLQKENSASDLRCNHIRITEKGEQVLSLAHTQLSKIDNRLFEGFSDTDIETLTALLGRCVRNLSDGEAVLPEVFRKKFNENIKGEQHV